MQQKNEKVKNIVLIVLLVSVIALSIAYAALSATLTINATGIVKGNGNNWDIEFVKTATDSDATHMTCVAGGYATVTTQPTIISTSFSGLRAEFKTPGDSVVCKWNVENNGQIDAYLKTLTKPTDAQLVCSGSGASQSADEAAVCGNIHYTLTYDPSGAITPGTSSTGDALNPGQDQGLILTIKYDENASTLPANDVTVTGFDTIFLYEQK